MSHFLKFWPKSGNFPKFKSTRSSRLNGQNRAKTISRAPNQEKAFFMLKNHFSFLALNLKPIFVEISEIFGFRP